MRMRLRLPATAFLCAPSHESGFTLLECMLAIVLMTVGLLAAAGSFPSLMRAALYGKDQTRAAGLAEEQMELYRNAVPSTLGSYVGDYGTVASQYFDQDGNSTTQGAAYFTRDVQIQFWTWNALTNAFVRPANPYVAPAGSYLFHVSVATHWPVNGQTTFVTGTTSGCVSAGSTVPVGFGCITVSSFINP